MLEMQDKHIKEEMQNTVFTMGTNSQVILGLTAQPDIVLNNDGGNTKGEVLAVICHYVDSVDINFTHKQWGYMALDSTQFTFIGPDRLPRKIDEMSDYVHMDHIIKDKRLPNYRGVLLPLKSGLNVDCWGHFFRYQFFCNT